MIRGVDYFQTVYQVFLYLNFLEQCVSPESFVNLNSDYSQAFSCLQIFNRLWSGNIVLKKKHKSYTVKIPVVLFIDYPPPLLPFLSFSSSDLIQCTNEMNVNIPQLADTLFERTTNTSWVVVFKSLTTTHHLMVYGNEVRT